MKGHKKEKKLMNKEGFLNILARQLGESDVSQLRQDVNLGDFGVDSLTLTEIKDSLATFFGINIPLYDIRKVGLFVQNILKYF